MSQQPFSRPGAVDLSGLNQPGAGRPGAPAGGAAPTGGGSYWLDVTQENFQPTVESSLTAPVLLVFYSPSRLPESTQMAADLDYVPLPAALIKQVRATWKAEIKGVPALSDAAPAAAAAKRM